MAASVNFDRHIREAALDRALRSHGGIPDGVDAETHANAILNTAKKYEEYVKNGTESADGAGTTSGV